MAGELRRRSREDISTRQPNPGIGFMSLPPEVRYTIYRHLFCHSTPPIWLGTKYMGLRGLELSEPTFHTQAFRISKEIYLDAVAFAYSANDFVLRDTFPAFCRLGSAPLGAIKDLTVIHSTWTAAYAKEDDAWEEIRTKCLNLRCLELDLHADVLLEAVRYLGGFFASLDRNGPRPTLALDLYVWERHFSFVDNSDRDYARSLNLLHGTHEKGPTTPRFIHPKKRVMRLPPSARDIVLSADVNSGAILALDTFLDISPQIMLRKAVQSLPKTGRRACGRSVRYCYVWSDGSQTADRQGIMLEGTSREPINIE